jgi:GNAT superfamily N-acetyltransferase
VNVAPIELTIRGAQPPDAQALARLVTQLGYPTNIAQMQQRLAVLLSLPDYHTFVACMADRVVGMASVWLGHALEFDGRYGRITTVAVDESVRHQGVGRALMQYVEQWLRAQQAVMVTLTSAAHRHEAHKFYEALGYDGNGIRFKRWLKSDINFL